MAAMESWDVLLLVVVGYLAVNMLARLMIAHRNRVIGRLREEAEPPEQTDTSQTRMPRRPAA